MYDRTDLIKSLKKLAKETFESIDPSNAIYGEVINAEPLEIKIDQKLTLSKMQLILTRNVTDWEEEIEIDWTNTTHNHGFNGEGSVIESNTGLKGKYKIKHLTSLKVGEKVILLQLIGGQEYVVIDRV